MYWNISCDLMWCVKFSLYFTPLPFPWVWTTFNFRVQHCVDLYGWLNMRYPDRHAKRPSFEFWVQNLCYMTCGCLEIRLGLSHTSTCDPISCVNQCPELFSNKRGTPILPQCVFIFFVYLFSYFRRVYQKTLRTAGHRKWKKICGCCQAS